MVRHVPQGNSRVAGLYKASLVRVPPLNQPVLVMDCVPITLVCTGCNRTSLRWHISHLHLAQSRWPAKKAYLGLPSPWTSAICYCNCNCYATVTDRCRSEWTYLFEFIQAKQLRIENFKEVQRGPGAAPTPYALDDDVDAGEQGELCCARLISGIVAGGPPRAF